MSNSPLFQALPFYFEVICKFLSYTPILIVVLGWQMYVGDSHKQYSIVHWLYSLICYSARLLGVVCGYCNNRQILLDIVFGEERQSSENRGCFYWKFKNWVPIFKGRSTRGKGVVYHLEITILCRIWKPFWCTAAQKEKKNISLL